MEQDVREKEQKQDKEIRDVMSAVQTIGRAIGSGKADLSVMDEELFTELFETGYGLGATKEGQGKRWEPLEESYLALYREIASGKTDSNRLMEKLLFVLSENINYTYTKKKEWTELLAKTANIQPIEKFYDVREMFMQQNGEGDAYGRWDTVVRYLAIENYYGKNDYGFRLYEKMQEARNGKDYLEYAVATFRNLIASFDAKGYDGESHINCDANLNLTDGSHRMALCLYHGVPQIKVKVIRGGSATVEFGEAWFRENGFTDEECELIRSKCNELIAKCKQTFTCILWPPAAMLFDEITEEIGKLYPIVSQKDYTYTEETFQRLVWGVYHIDDIEDWKVEKKLSYMAATPEKRVRVVEVAIDAPKFRLKASTNQTLSRAGEELKATIRAKFMERIENYFYDIIIHTGDNFKQNVYMEKLFRQAFSLREYFAQIEKYPYYIMKKDAPYQTPDFPDTYAFSKDLDIVCERENYVSLVETTRTFLKGQVVGYEMREIDEGDNYRIRVELDGYLIFQFDISVGVAGLTEAFAKESLVNRMYIDGYYVPQMRDELCIRALSYAKNPKKQHHLEYIQRNQSAFDMEYYEKCIQHGGER